MNINDERASKDYYEEIYLMDDFSTDTAGARLLGIDTNTILNKHKESKNKIIEILQNEINKEDKSILINQIIETNQSFKYEETLQCLENIVKGLKK